MISACGKTDAEARGHGGEKVLWFIISSWATDRKTVRG